jgi:hypothetical protein
VLDNELQTRFARSCTDAAFGYARAATAAYSAVASQTFEFWANAAKPASERRVPPSRAEQDPMSIALGAWPNAWPNPALDFFKMSQAWAGTPWMGAAWPGSPWAEHGANGAAAQLAFSPVAAWWAMFPLNGNPASWPMAYGLMSAGVPREIAWPTAEANAAAIDAAEAASDALESAFATYQSDSGYAMAHIMMPPKRLVAAVLLAPFGASLAFPWIMATRASGL